MRRRNGLQGSSSGEQMRRTDSNLSSTSSDIEVAPGRSKRPSPSQPPQRNLSSNGGLTILEDIDSYAKCSAEVKDGRLLVARLTPLKLQTVLDRPSKNASHLTPNHFTTNGMKAVDDADDDDDSGGGGGGGGHDDDGDEADGGIRGPNARGTYSKEYTLRHPEIKWVHRGQGRYLPASEIKKESAPLPIRRSRYVVLLIVVEVVHDLALQMHGYVKLK